nr:MAG TPA: Putative exonuclease [Caudoviricetes sp.]
MELSAENYYSEEANREYMSVSQFKSFSGTDGKVACEASAMAELNGEWEMKKTTALMVGSYVDSYFEGTLEEFKQRNSDIFTQKGTLKADYQKAESIIKRIEQDSFFMKCISGEKQVIMTGELFGAKWKIKIDSYIPDTVIVDLKVMSSITKLEWIRDLGYVDFIRYWGYDIQGAVYQEIVRQNTGKKLPFYIAAATKEDETNIEVIHIADNFLRDALSIVEANMPRILKVKSGQEEPERCGNCAYCRKTKVLTGPIGILDLLKDV